MSKKARLHIVDGDCALIPLTCGKTAIVDLADLPLVSGVNWSAKRGKQSFYATRTGVRQADGSRPFLQMHRVIMGARSGEFVDHINLNGLDCRRENMRIATPAENSRNRGKQRNNTTGFKGVTLFHGRYQAHIRHEGKKIHLGCYDTAQQAHLAYQQGASRLHGDFARAE